MHCERHIPVVKLVWTLRRTDPSHCDRCELDQLRIMARTMAKLATLAKKLNVNAT